MSVLPFFMSLSGVSGQIPPPPTSTSEPLWAGFRSVTEWIQRPKAIRCGNATIVGYVQGPDGRKEVAHYDHAADELTTGIDVSVPAIIEYDDHDPPTFYERPSDNRLLAFLTGNRGSHGYFYTRLSTNPRDGRSWGNATQVYPGPSGAGGVAYTSPLPAPDGLWVLLRRGSGGTDEWVIQPVTDDGAVDSGRSRKSVWYRDSSLVGTTRPYLHAVNNPVRGRWDFCGSDSSAGYNSYGTDRRNRKLYHFSRDYDGIFRNTEGDIISGQHLDHSLATVIKEELLAGNLGNWQLDITIDDQNKPRILYQVNPTDTTPGLYPKEYWVAYLDESNVWQNVQVVVAGKGISPQSQYSPAYAGAGAFDRGNHNRLVLSVERSGILEIEIWESPDNGASWAMAKQITTGSTYDNFRPFYVYGAVPGSVGELCWCGQGSYTWYTNWDCRMVGNLVSV